MVSAKDLSPEDLSWFTNRSEKHSEDQEELIWIVYETEYSRGRMIINPKNLKKLGKSRIKKIYKLLQTIGQIVEHGSIRLNNEFLAKLIELTNTKGRL